MIRQRSSQLAGSFVIIVIILFTSCNGNNSTPATTDTLNAPTTTTAAAGSKQENLTSGYLDTLWFDAGTFAKLNPKLIFRFYLNSIGAITMNGWVTNNSGTFSKNPDVELAQGKASTVKYGPGDYFGNLLLSASDLNAIQKLIQSNNSLYILFAPIDPATAQYKGQITYNILLTNDDPHPLVKIPHVNLVSTGVTTNPSPPGIAN